MTNVTDSDEADDSRSNSSTGITSKIRKQLNFTDDSKWKQFSSRRLELIDKFNLSERKASEQDQPIKQIAHILRTEFNYPLPTSNKFEKLVTAAVQSVRRNRKRSIKRRNVALMKKNASLNNPRSTITDFDNEFSSNVSSSSTSPTPSNIPLNNGTPDRTCNFRGPSIVSINASTKLQPILHKPSLASKKSSSPPLLSNNIQNINGKYSLPLPLPLQNKLDIPFTHNQAINTIKIPSCVIQPKLSSITTSDTSYYSKVLKSMISELLDNVVPLSEQEEKDKLTSNNLANILSDVNQTGNSYLKQSEIPFFLKKQILRKIQQSKTCSGISKASDNLITDITFANLKILGKSSLKISLSYILERFFNNDSKSMEYILEKFWDQTNLSQLAVNLFQSSMKNYKIQDYPINDLQTHLLYLLIGSIIKDFGFDDTLYQLGEIAYSNIMIRYPLTSSRNTAIYSTLPMNPEKANEKLNKSVIIKYKDSFQEFNFNLLTNSPPTIMEILENCSKLFKIEDFKKFGIFHNNELTENDGQLNQLFKDLNCLKLSLELREIQ
ncbi:hypothetical protein KAFR_0I01770 [Kazachstania africana CBS 2517]|uniref:Transcription factor VHR1 n=1 Tax=Kazachstania africana (strain ATCC 22294 / BCRC 22015 / CBS 2517 / CECT 1963 / NBRC 1671 / NRRL Y-8276) TaxID=1071382 RepID=H2B008_KAZAF|nr:hypothetical protein KAFR_0I01770 [Kazachstania africana CBS 2517]CCF59958.1 hypothetical protein KAFR_0I01770 [Kazachstania africana CBS 2517]